MIKNAIAEMEKQMKKTVDAFRGDLATLRTGRANAALLEDIRVAYYGSQMNLKQVANVSIPEARTIEIKPWDPGVLPEIEKAILKSDLGITPNNDGKIIRISIPKLTEDRRRDLVKTVKKMAEEYRVSVRSARRDTMDQVKKAEKEKTISEDERKSSEQVIQKLTDACIKQVDDILGHKEQEIMEV
ncbi:MAG: ribosome recycling factor [Elusimicrobia bacterium]|nr:ribosome recycling factor [Elusimicrobiota bacterium]